MGLERDSLSCPWVTRKRIAAAAVYSSSNTRCGISRIGRALMIIGGWGAVGWMTRGLEDVMQDGGQRVKARRDEVQSSLGLCAFSQSVPNIMSCVATEVT